MTVTAPELAAERFAAMGTRIELHVFGPDYGDALIAAVDDAPTIHRPSPTTALNDRPAAGRSAAIDHPIVFAALAAVAAVHPDTDGLFDPTVGSGAGPGRCEPAA